MSSLSQVWENFWIQSHQIPLAKNNLETLKTRTDLQLQQSEENFPTDRHTDRRQGMVLQLLTVNSKHGTICYTEPPS
jgi:hypothetical protein